MSGTVAGISAPQGLAEVLRAPWIEADVTSLRDALYQRAFARDLTGPVSAGGTIPASELTRLLSAANQSHDRWQSGWRIERVADTRAIVATSGARRRTANPGDYTLTFTEHLPPRSGMAATLRFARESLTVQSGVYYAFGDAIPEEGDEADPLRVYFQAPEEALADLYSHLTGRLNRLEIPFTLKTLLAPSDRNRSDATVLYVSRRHRIQVEAVLRQLPGSLLSRLGPRTPLFTLRLAPGIGMAESPGGGESFGMNRCRLLAESILEARRDGNEDEVSRLRAVARRFQAAGIDLNQPHLHFGHRDVPAVETPRVVLAAANVIGWLRGRGLIPNDDRGTCWRVTSHASRNRNFAVAREDGSGYFVKQLRVQGGESLRMMEREASVYELLAEPDGRLRDLSPAFYGFDRGTQALTFALLPGVKSAAEAQQSLFPVALAKAAGRTLGLLHRRPIDDLTGAQRAERFDRCPPGIYTAHRGGPLVRWLGIGQLQLIDRVREHPLLAPALDRMSADWRCTRLIHGDVKWENCLWTEASTGAPTLKWIDWELADLGDSCWDAGCFVQAYLSHWVRSLPPQTEWSLTDRMQQGAGLLSAMRPALWAFLEEYFAAIETHESDVAALTERIMCCAAARMIQMGLEVMHGQAGPTPQAICLLGTSAEIMTRPGEALSLLLADRAG